jgi:hypothetical protein
VSVALLATKASPPHRMDVLLVPDLFSWIATTSKTGRGAAAVVVGRVAVP